MYGGVAQQRQRGAQPDHVEALVPGDAPEGVQFRIVGEVARLRHMNLQVDQHIALLGRRADGELIAQVLGGALGGLLIARICGQHADKEVRRIVGLRAIVAMIRKEAQRMLRRSRKGDAAIRQQHHVVEVIKELRAGLQ